MPIGKYERPIYEVECSVCRTKYTQNRKPIEKAKCKKCQKKENDKVYYEKNKGKILEYIKKDEVKKRKLKTNTKYYHKNKDIISQKQKDYYQDNKEHILKRAEKYRRDRGEKPNGLSGTEEVALSILKKLFPKVRIVTKDRKTIRNPNTKAYLELDFYLPKLNLAIELNGPTHYKPIYGKAKFERQLLNDQIKREVCKRLGITLIEIPLEEGVHYDRFSVEHDKLRRTIMRFLRFREDKNADQCTWKDHIGGD